MIRELNVVAMAVDLPDHALNRGDRGAVVLIHREGAFEVEFVEPDGSTIALLTLTDEQLVMISPDKP